MMRAVLRKIYRLLWICFSVFPIDRKKVVLQSFGGRAFSDNPKYIAEELYRIDPALKLYWAASDVKNAGTPPYVRAVRYKSVSYLYHMATAKVWVDNIRKPFSHKRKGQYYMQTWHGGFTFKRVENAAADQLDPGYVREAKIDASKTDVMLSNCDSLTEMYHRDFWYENGEVLQCGLPRNDRLFTFTEQDAAAIRARLDLAPETRVLLYAPTFRKNGGMEAYDLDFARCCRALEARFGGSWIILLKLHPNLREQAKTARFDSRFVRNVTDFNDIQELYMISDALVTDYSSVIFDFILLRRFAFFYANDIASYQRERGTYFSFSDFPFALCENNDQAERAILDYEEGAYREKLEGFISAYHLCDNGTASAAAAGWIKEKMQA